MKYPVYAIKDQKFAFSAQLICEQNDQTMARGFGFMVNNPDSVMNYSPKDYDLFKVGEFDTDTGEITKVWPVQYIMNGVDVLTEK